MEIPIGVPILLVLLSITMMRGALRVDSPSERIGAGAVSLGTLVLSSVAFSMRPGATPLPTPFLMTSAALLLVGAVLGISAIVRDLVRRERSTSGLESE